MFMMVVDTIGEERASHREAVLRASSAGPTKGEGLPLTRMWTGHLECT